LNKIIGQFFQDVKGCSHFVLVAKLPLIIPFIFLFGCGPVWRGSLDRRYDNSLIYLDPAKNELVTVLKSIHRIETVTRFTFEGDVHTTSGAGLATALDKHTLLTARHLVKVDSFRVLTPFGVVEVPINESAKVEEKSFIIEEDGTRVVAQRIYVDKEGDFAILRTNRELTSFPFSIGNSDELQVGNVVFLLGNFQTGFSVRMGNVTQLDFTTYGARGEVANVNRDIFGISAPTVEGDSGGPILCVRDGQLELIGMVTFLVERARGLGYCLKINTIADQIKKNTKDQDLLRIWK
jgi:S1-C subfamily serine protease